MSTRRGFLKGAGAIGAGYWISGCATSVREGRSKSPNERLNVACVGTGGQGGSDMGNVGKTENIVALCDIDKQRNAEALKKYPGAKVYDDYRVMLEEMDSQIDAVTIGTPDHHHAPATAMAIRLGK